MHLLLDGRGPLHAQLTRALKSTLFTGSARTGERLPATRSLARELGVSRNTVLAAYEQLRAEGLVDGRVGSGSYVASPLQASRPAIATEGPGSPAQSAYARRMRAFHDNARLASAMDQQVRHRFQYGMPLTNPALTNLWARELSRAALYTRPAYPPVQGLPALREAVCDYLARRRGVQAMPEDVLIVAGTQQAIALTSRVLLDAGDSVAIEDPQYFATRRVLQIHGATLCAVPVDGDGLVVDALPVRAPRLVCVTPSHQFPSGAVMSLPRRLDLLDYARRQSCWIFEDDYDGEFRYNGQPLAALRSLDDTGRVIYVGSFSKTLFPALRLGYLVMPPGLRQDFIAAKWAEDFGSPAIEQAALANFIAGGGFERHLRRSAKTLAERRAALMRGLEGCSRGRLEIADSNAGMHVAVWLRDKSRAQGEALIAYARTQGLGLNPIAPSYLMPPDRAGLLMGFGAMSPSEIEQGIEVFARCLDHAYGEHERAHPSAQENGPAAQGRPVHGSREWHERTIAQRAVAQPRPRRRAAAG